MKLKLFMVMELCISVHDDQRNGKCSIVTGKFQEKIEDELPDDDRLTTDELSAMSPQIFRSMKQS